MRDFERTVFSHSGWDGGAQGHAMMMAIQLAGLAHDASKMPRGTWKVLHYDDLEREADYVDLAVAAVAFLRLKTTDDTFFSEAFVRAAAKRVRKRSWQAPSAKHSHDASATMPVRVTLRSRPCCLAAWWASERL